MSRPIRRVFVYRVCVRPYSCYGISIEMQASGIEFELNGKGMTVYLRSFLNLVISAHS